MTGSGRPGNGVPADIRTDVAHPARVYDYWLGGKDNFAADRAAAEQVLQVMPEILDTARGNRRFLVRAVGFLRDAGIGQFLDIGSGLPSSPNVHEIAQAGGTGARVVYVDHDPVAFSHAEAMTAKDGATAVVMADLRDTGEVLSGAGKLLDYTRPVGLLFVGCLHHIPDSDDPALIVARYLTALAPGSYLVISHATDEFSPAKMRANADVADSSGTMLVPRGKDAILRMFNGRELVDPGLVLVSRWRPEGGDPGPNADRAWAYGGVAALQQQRRPERPPGAAGDRPPVTTPRQPHASTATVTDVNTCQASGEDFMSLDSQPQGPDAQLTAQRDRPNGKEGAQDSQI